MTKFLWYPDIETIFFCHFLLLHTKSHIDLTVKSNATEYIVWLDITRATKSSMASYLIRGLFSKSFPQWNLRKPMGFGSFRIIHNQHSCGVCSSVFLGNLSLKSDTKGNFTYKFPILEWMKLQKCSHILRWYCFIFGWIYLIWMNKCNFIYLQHGSSKFMYVNSSIKTWAAQKNWNKNHWNTTQHNILQT